MPSTIKTITRPARERIVSLGWSLRKKPSLLEVLAIFKNEGHIIREWVQHYLDQGVDRITLINNNSSDNYLEELAPFLANGVVSLAHDPGKYIQARVYEEALPTLRRQTKWLIVCDLDEFIYARKGFHTIREYVASLPSVVSCIQIPWKVFGSSGFIDHPGSGVRTNFTGRKCYEQLSDDDFGVLNGRISCKYIARLDRVRHLYVHRTELFWGDNCLPDGTIVASQVRQPVSESALSTYPVHCNHYALQSEEYFRRVKMTRGAADFASRDNVRTMSYFRHYDNNELQDRELADIVTQGSPLQ